MPLQFARNPFFHLPALRHICSFLTEDMAGSTATAMVLSCLDYTNLLLCGCSAYNMAQLQHIQNTAAHIVLDSQHPCPAQQLLSLVLAASSLLHQLQNSHFNFYVSGTKSTASITDRLKSTNCNLGIADKARSAAILN